jgi:hypothetical protein
MTVCIGLCVYNNGFGLPYVFNNIERIQTLFTEKINIIIAYDESHDNSLGYLISKKHYFNIRILKNLDVRSTSRVENISNARNKIVNYINVHFPDTEYMIMMDSNEYSCIGDIYVDTLREVLEKKDEWDAVSFDRDAGYYDHWALSFDPFIYSFFHTQNYQIVVAKMREMFNKILEKAKITGAFIPVYSAFNGFSIYKWSIFKNCKYNADIELSFFPKKMVQKQIEITGVPIISNFTGDCEHRHFHLQAIHQYDAKIRIYPKSLFALFNGDKKVGCRGSC